MKKSIRLAIFFFCLNFSLNAQIDRHTFMVGGSLSFDNSKSENSNNSFTTLKISPSVGYFLINNLAIGTELNYRKYESFYSVSIAPFLRYYVKNFYGEVQYGYYVSNNASDSFLKFDIGYALFLNDNVSLEPAFYLTEQFDGSNVSGRNIGMQIGLQVYLNR